MTAAFPDDRSRLVKLAEVSAWSVTALSFALSYATQVGLASGPGRFHGWEAAVWPACSDVAAFTALVIALDQAKRNRPARLAWFISMAAAGVSVVANIGSVSGHAAAMAVHAWPPLISVSVFYLLVHHVRKAGETGDSTTTRRRDTRNRPAVNSGPAPAKSAVSTVSGNGHGPAARPPKAERAAIAALPADRVDTQPTSDHGSNGHRLTAAEAAAQLEADGQPVTAAALAELRQVSERQARRDLKALSNGNGSVGG